MTLQIPDNHFLQLSPTCFTFIFIIFLFSLPLKSWASPPSDQLKGMTLEQLANIEVTTVSKEPEEVWNTPAAIYVITQDDIRRSGATSLPEVLRLAPGVEVSRVDSDHWAVGIRGFGSGFSRAVLVLMDGRSLYTPLFEGVYWEVQDYVLEDIDRIEVIRGPGGTIWGANAVNGVINIITKNAKDTRGSLAAIGGGNIDTGMAEARYGGHHGSSLDYRIFAKGFLRDPEHHLDGINYDEWRRIHGGFRVDAGTGNNAFTLEGDAYKEGEGEISNIAFFNPPSTSNFFDTARTSGASLTGSWKRTLDNGSGFLLSGYYDRTSRHGIQYGETRNTFDLDFMHHLAGLPRQDFSWGLGMRVSPSTFIQTQQTVDFLPHQQTDSVYSGFVQDEFHILPRKFSVTVGSKLEHNNFSGFEIQPSVRALYAPTSTRTFWGAITRAVRTPSRLDQDLQLTGLVLPTPPIFIEVDGTPGFRSETLLGYEAGYRTLLRKNVYLSLAFFNNDYDNLEGFGAIGISTPATPAPPHILFTVPEVNAVQGSTYGGEISPEWQVNSWWKLRASYSYINLDLRSKPGIPAANTVTADEGSTPHNMVLVQSFINLPKGLEFDQTYRYNSALPAQLVRAYQTADLHLAWRFAQHFSISLAGQNLFQPFHLEWGSGIPAPPVAIERSAYIQLTWMK